jgi:2-haloacid dehalogenase
MSGADVTEDRWITFDCYGTLVDWKGGMARAIESVAPGKAKSLLETYHQLEPVVEAERPFRRYREVLAETLRRAAQREGVILAPGAEYVLAQTLPDWPLFPDVEQALRTLRKSGWKLAILSNVDRDLIAGTLTRLPIPFDAIVTAEDVQAYKPAHAHFQRFAERSDATSANWIHVAASWFHDIVPASQLGIRTVWINREGEQSHNGLAAVELPDMHDLPDTLSRLAATQ